MLWGPIWQPIAWCFGIQWAGWAVSYSLGTEKLYDLTGSATYVLMVLWATMFMRACSVWRQKVQAALAIAWALRCGQLP